MMIIIDTLEKIFNILLPISLLTVAFTGVKQKILEDSKKTKEVASDDIGTCWKSNVETFMAILSIIFLLGVIIFLWIKCKISWILIACAFPVYIQNIIEAYISIGIVRDVISVPQKEKLSIREKNAIGTVAYIVWLCGVFNIFEKILDKVEKIENAISWDMFMTLSYVFLEFIYIFFICALFPNLIFFAITILKKINRFIPLKHKFQKYENYFIERCDKSIKINSLVIKCIDKIIKRGLINKLIGSFFLPISFCSDIIVSSFLSLITMMRSVIGYLFLLFRLLKRTMNKITRWISQLSDRRIVAMSFRIAFIMALV